MALNKISLDKKADTEAFTFTGKLTVTLSWKTETDLDLCLFYRMKEGASGGIFSHLYRSNRSDCGYLDKFPYMRLDVDAQPPKPGRESHEQITIVNLDDIYMAYIVVVNYTAAVQIKDVTFADDAARIEVKGDSGDNLALPLDSCDKGNVYLACTIKNDHGILAIKHEDRVTSLSEAYYTIPGFSLITNDY